MRVGMDISQTAHTGGVGVYTRNLAENLSKLPFLEMAFFYSSLRKPFKNGLPNVKSFRLPPVMFELLFNRLRNVSIEKFIGRVDIFHSSDWVQPPTKARKVTTYHDLIPIKFPGWSDPRVVSVQKRRLKLVEKEIDLVIAVSENTKKDLTKVSNIPGEKIKVIYEGVEEFFRPLTKEQTAFFKKKVNLPDRFILAISGIGKRKNLDRIKKASEGYPLIILGQDIKVERRDLPFLYCAADVLVYAPLYEGFGLPVLEAMACGVPVVCSEVSSLPEVGGRSVSYVNPESVEDIRNKIKTILEDEKFGGELSEKGLEQAKKFSWEKCAKETFEAYLSLAG